MYKWSFKDYPKQTNLKVFGTFICGGGSTMGFKLAGFNHLGGVELDPKVSEVYKLNHNPKYLYTEDIREFLKRKDLPKELYNLDVLEGSPPCSSFSIAGNREKDWGKEKKFAEGQKMQRLDDLFFDWIELVEKLQPKVAIAENVKGLILGNAKAYCNKIIKKLNEVGYDVQVFLLNSAFMGVPQKRERVFFICKRKDLNLPKLVLEFNEQPIFFKDIREIGKGKKLLPTFKSLLPYAKKGDFNFSSVAMRLYGKNSYFNSAFLYDDKVVPTLMTTSDHQYIKWEDKLTITENEMRLASTFPQDYTFKNRKPGFFMGMSVPPVMMKKIAEQIRKQWFER